MQQIGELSPIPIPGLIRKEKPFRLVGIHGGNQSGKDTVADMIKDWCFENAKSFRREAFADKPKQAVAGTLGIPVDDVDSFKLQGEVIVRYAAAHGLQMEVMMDGRDFIKQFATEGGRDIHGWDCWVDLLLPRINWHHNFGEAAMCVIPDARFDNEATRIRELGGEMWFIEGRGERPTNHRSDAGLEPVGGDPVIRNTAGLDHLRNEVEAFLG